MRIAPYWARAEFKLGQATELPVSVTCRGYSDNSLDDARRNARYRAETVARRLAENSRLGRYEYGTGPLPEAVVEKFEDASGALLAAVTRNAYGALILNVRDLMFVDIDAAHSATGTVSKLFRALGFGSEKTVEELLQEKIQVFIKENSRAGVRVYRTAAGYRLMILGSRFDPAGLHAEAIFKRFDADTLYAKLCRTQGSFRARLTPKPWRVSLTPPPVSFPYETADAERKLSEWVREYDATSNEYATCSFVQEVGASEQDSTYAELICKHDELTRAHTPLALA